MPAEFEGEEGRRSSTDLPAVGAVIDSKYQVERVLGAGGMGVVVAARHLQLGQQVAIKFMLAEATRDTDAVERFLREARAAVALRSEHVARVLDVGTLASGAPFIVMEYLAGEDLAHVLKSHGPLPVPLAAGLVLQACDALAEAHAQGVVHRDLKPGNLFVTTRRDGSPFVKVLDFGISKSAHLGRGGDAQSLTVSGTLMGSPAYMSPEQVRSSKDVDARSDVWSLGVILYELLTGSSPFLGETLGDTFARIASEAPPSIRQRRPEVPRGLCRLVEQCLERKVEDRIDSISTLAARLAEFAAGDANAGSVGSGRAGFSAGAVPFAPRQETVVASSTIACDPENGQEAHGTEPPWLRSSSAHVPRRSDRMLVGGAVAAGVLVLAVGGAVWGTRSSAPASAAGAGSKVQPAVPPPSPVEPPLSIHEAPPIRPMPSGSTEAAAVPDPPAPRTEDAGHRSTAAASQPRPSLHPSTPPKGASAQPTAPRPEASTIRHEVDVF